MWDGDHRVPAKFKTVSHGRNFLNFLDIDYATMAATGALTAPSVLHAAPPAAQHIVVLPDAGGLMEGIFPHALAA
jgi:hypothetical protein